VRPAQELELFPAIFYLLEIVIGPEVFTDVTPGPPSAPHQTANKAWGMSGYNIPPSGNGATH